MSATSRPLRRPRVCTASASTGAPPAPRAPGPCRAGGGTGRRPPRRATASRGAPPRTASRTRAIVASVERGGGAGGDQGEDSAACCAGNGRPSGKQGRARADRRRADLQRQVGAGAAFGAALGRHGDQRRLDAGLPRAAHPDRAAHARTRRRGAAPRSTASVRPRSPAASPGGDGGAGGDGGVRRCPILCGGTGLYLRALTQGLADIPDPGAAARAEARALLAAQGAPALHARLAEADPGRPPAAPERRPARGPRVGGVARHRARPGGMAGGRAGAGRLVVPHGAAGSAAAGAARRHRRPVRRHAGGGRAGRSGCAAGAAAGPGAAGHARARGARAGRLPSRRDALAEAERRACWRRRSTPSGRRRGSGIKRIGRQRRTH